MRFRRRKRDDNREPAQVYGSDRIEIAWTVIPILIVLVLSMATARAVVEVQNKRMPAEALHVTVIGHQWWWEFRYPKLGIVTANELHVPVSSVGKPALTSLTPPIGLETPVKPLCHSRSRRSPGRALSSRF